MKRVGVIGGSGYTGGELLRILLHHPRIEVSCIYSSTKAGEKVEQTHEDLLGQTNWTFTDELDSELDILFLCLGHGNSQKFLEEHPNLKHIKIIDLGNDFRLDKNHKFEDRSFIYGLPEKNRDQIKDADSIANPGCFATAIQLALLPLKDGVFSKGEVYVNAITGSTGAGIMPSSTTHFSWRNNNLSWYKPFTHQHNSEIMEGLGLRAQKENQFYFLPYRGDFARGIFATILVNFDSDIEEAKQLYKKYYAHHHFVKVADKEVYLKQVINSNYCHLHLHKYNNKLLITSVLDNLIKGASGQAVQNMNLMMGWEEDLGLKQLKANVF